jgi:hypothetical protein
MPYSMELFQDQLKLYPIPKPGDIFVVTEIEKDVLDPHFGRCIFIMLRPLKNKETKTSGETGAILR